MKVKCMDKHFRTFKSYIQGAFYLVYYCIHCNRDVMTVAITAGPRFRRNKLKNKKHTCKARLKELEK